MGEEAAQASGGSGEIWSLLQDQSDSCYLRPSLLNSLALAYSAPAMWPPSLSSDMVSIHSPLSPLPETSRDVPPAFIQDTTKVTSPERPCYPHLVEISPSLLHSPFPDLALLISAPLSLPDSLRLLSLSPGLECKLHEGKTWSADRHWALGAQDGAWHIVGAQLIFIE